MEKPLPMPHRMRSNATFQPKVAEKIQPTLDDPSSIKDSKVHDDNIS